MNREVFVAGAARSVTPGASLPVGTHIRYYAPAPALLTAITGYNAYGAVSDARVTDWFLPAPAMICIAADAGPIGAAIGNRRYPQVDPVSVYGPSSAALQITSHGGVVAGIGISPIGWARLFRQPASSVHNQVVPLASLDQAPLAAVLLEALADAPDDDAIPARFDAALTPLMAQPHPDEPILMALSTIIAAGRITEVEALCDATGVSPVQLRRIAMRYFGMTPKRLLRRARFLRAFLQLFRTGELGNEAPIAEGYFDSSHFLRDANAFLGTTPRRFMQRATPFLDMSLRTRAAVLGTATQALHGPESAAR